MILELNRTDQSAVGNVSVSASVPSGAVSNILSATATYGFDQRTGECRIVTPVKPNCTYDDLLTVTMGAGTHNVVRFVGLVREFIYQDTPQSVTTVANGRLVRAVEFENHQETVNQIWLGAGGILIDDILGSPSGSAAAIVQAVLSTANVPFTPANIQGSSVAYGTGQFPMTFMWHSGGPGPLTMPAPQEQGETAMSYIERYDAIDAEIAGTNTGGRYRTFEQVGGTVFRLRIGGRPQGTPNLTFTEGVNILSGQFTRSIREARSRFVVKGQNRSDGGQFGPLTYEWDDAALVTGDRTYQFSSDMIERADNSTNPFQAPDGMSCQTLAQAFHLEYNREQVTGWLETFIDDLILVANTHLVQGGPGGTVGALGLAENVWVQSVQITVDSRGFTQRMTYLGGGLPEGLTNMDLDFMNSVVQQELLV